MSKEKTQMQKAEERMAQAWHRATCLRIRTVYADSPILNEYEMVADLFEVRWERQIAETGTRELQEPEAESSVAICSDGVPWQRLKAIGNGQVPAVAACAFVLLYERALS